MKMSRSRAGSPMMTSALRAVLSCGRFLVCSRWMILSRKPVRARRAPAATAGSFLYMAARTRPSILPMASSLATLGGPSRPTGVSLHVRGRPSGAHSTVYRRTRLATSRRRAGRSRKARTGKRCASGPRTSTRPPCRRRAPPGRSGSWGDRGGGQGDIRVFATVDDELEELVERRREVGVDVVAQIDPRRQGGFGRAAQRLAAHGPADVPGCAPQPLGDGHGGDRAAHRGALAEAWVEARGAREAHGRTHQSGVVAAGLGDYDGALLGGRLIGQREVLERVCLLYTSPSPRDGLLSRMPS